MSILKGIMHHWNKSTRSYDTIHPETEVAQVTDWNQGIVNTLASTGLSSLVNVLSSDSLLALLIKKVFDATGVKYLLGQNGYVCFGFFYGGLIMLWGSAASSQWAGVLTFTYPIALKNRVLYAVAQEENPYAWRENKSVSISSAFYNQSLASCQVIAKTVVNGGNVLDQDSSTKVLIIGY